MRLQEIINGLALGMGITALSCGGTTNNYYGVDPQQDGSPQEQMYDNPCGNSRWYGKHLWEISSCKWGWYMDEGCTIKVAEDATGYQEKFRKWDQPATYDGINIEITFEGMTHPGRLDPLFRFTADGGAKWQDANAALDKYNGGVTIVIGVKADDIGGNVFVPVEYPFPGNADCQLSEYYFGY